MTNEEFEMGFDILYNNIVSNQAPGLNTTEMEFFLNKAQIEVVKNHINGKGNKYGEGYDGSPKRQVEFSSLTKDLIIHFTLKNTKFAPATYMLPFTYKGSSSSIDYSNSTDIDNVNIPVQDENDNNVYDQNDNLVTVMTISVTQGSNGSESSEQSYSGVDYNKILGIVNENLVGIYGRNSRLLELYNYAINPNLPSIYKTDNCPDLIKIQRSGQSYANLSVKTLSVVPISFSEYDKHLAQPFSLPNKNQAWRLTFADRWEIVLPTNILPSEYHIRYVEMPTPINLSNKEETSCSLPEILHQEVLQRAVELAKLSWEGSLNAVVTAGQNSE